MFKPTAVYEPLITQENMAKEGKTPKLGTLLITQLGEIIYANKQARHFLGLLADEPLPNEQTFFALMATAFQCGSGDEWLDWPKRPFATNIRHLNYKQKSPAFPGLRVEVLQQLALDKTLIWALTLVAEEPYESSPHVFASC